MSQDNDPYTDKPQTSHTGAVGTKLSSSNLQKIIFESDHPEHLIRTFPAQSLYMAVRQSGLSSAVEIILSASIEQCRTMIDLDLWGRDRFNEENFWEWLELPDACDDLRVLQKFLACADLKLVALIISRHIDSVVHEEATDAPPGDGFYTPDKGHSWLQIKTEDAHKQFLLGRFMALLFETNTKVFYQLLATPSVATDSVLEEDSFQERNKRLSAEGIPDQKLAEECAAPLSVAAAREMLAKSKHAPSIENIAAVTPFAHDTLTVQPLASVLAELPSSEEFTRALTHIMNSMIVQWGIPFHDPEVIQSLIFTVKGTLNVGLGKLQTLDNRPLIESALILGWKNVYRLGRNEIVALQKLSYSVPDELSDTDPVTQSILEAIGGTIAELPAFFCKDGSFEEQDGKLVSGTRAIETLQDVESATKYIEKALATAATES
jgi:hypothetical protein